MFERIVTLATKLDEAGFSRKAALLDVLIREAQAVLAPEFIDGATDVDLQEVPITDAPRALQSPAQPTPSTRPDLNQYREKVIFNNVLKNVTGLDPAILEYFLRDDVRQSIESLAVELEKAQTLEAGSPAQVEILRKVRNEFDELDPWNASRPQDKLTFLKEVATIADLLHQYIPVFNKPNYTAETIIDNLTKQLKEKGYLIGLNKAKKSL